MFVRAPTPFGFQPTSEHYATIRMINRFAFVNPHPLLNVIGGLTLTMGRKSAPGTLKQIKYEIDDGFANLRPQFPGVLHTYVLNEALGEMKVYRLQRTVNFRGLWFELYGGDPDSNHIIFNGVKSGANWWSHTRQMFWKSFKHKG